MATEMATIVAGNGDYMKIVSPVREPTATIVAKTTTIVTENGDKLSPLSASRHCGVDVA